MIEAAPAAADIARRALRWQCRRGMKELDLLLVGFLDQHYDRASSREREAFRALLELPDPELLGYLVAGVVPHDPDLARLTARLSGR